MKTKTNMRVIFVGIHNKPGMEPLDSRTKTGKVIDRIIDQLKPYECIKSNLFDKEYFPISDREIWCANTDWNVTLEPAPKDIIILLGNWTHKHFILTPGKIIKLAHPASFMYRSKEKTEEYINSSVEKIKAKLT
jgi:hypothetical protein